MSFGSDSPGGRADFGGEKGTSGGFGQKGGGDWGPSGTQGQDRKGKSAPAAEIDWAAIREAERLRKKRIRFNEHRSKVKAQHEQEQLIDEPDDFEQGQINKSLSAMRKYRDQSGAAKWDIQEVKDNPQKGLRRITAIREGLRDDLETGQAYETALKEALGANSFDLSLLDITKPENKKRKYKGDLERGFRFMTSAL